MTEDQLVDVLLTLDPKLVDEHVDAFLLDEDKLTLPQLIPRIIHERGPFVNITEAALEEEIASATTRVVEMGDVDEQPESVETSGSTSEEFFKDKNEVLKHVSSALNESSLALDFVGLLISCVRPVAGTISMSAHLKKFVPPGSLNADSVKKEISQQEKEERFRQEKNVGQGWKLSSIESSSGNLRSASARLSEEVHREKMFWDTIKRNFDTKEILYKTRDKTSGKRTFAVKYGYEDSGSTYKVTGNALLKPVNDDNHIEFVPLSNKTGNSKKVVKVRILAKQENDDEMSLVGESKVDVGLKKDETIKSQIEKARYFIFEDELFNQLLDEATGLIAYNVKAESESKICIELQDQCIEIEHVDYDDDTESDETRPQDSRAELFVTYLRLMLTQKHKQNMESKQQLTVLKPTSSSRGVTKPYSLILRPLVGHFRHEHLVQMVYAMVKNLLHNNSEARFTLRRYITAKDSEAHAFRRIAEPPVSKFTIRVADRLRIELKLDSFDFVNYRIHVKAQQQGKNVLDATFEDLRQIEECLEWVVSESG